MRHKQACNMYRKRRLVTHKTQETNWIYKQTSNAGNANKQGIRGADKLAT